MTISTSGNRLKDVETGSPANCLEPRSDGLGALLRKHIKSSFGPERPYDGTLMIRFLPVILLVFSNVFMTYAWYGHLKDMRAKPLLLVIAVSWSIAFFEYCLQVPANRLGSRFFELGQLKVIQEIVTMVVFAGFCFFYMKQKLTWDYLGAAVCLAGAAFFLFRNIPVK